MLAFDFPHFLHIWFWHFMPVLWLLCIVVGALLLWRRTKHIAALAQFVAAAGFFVCIFVDWLREFSAPPPFDTSWFAKLVWSSHLSDFGFIVMIICVLVFPIAYLWYAITQKRI